MAVGVTLLSAVLTSAELESGVFKQDELRAWLLCTGMALWIGAELLETVQQAQKICWSQFSSMAVFGVLPLLFWAGWKLEASVFSRSSDILWWILTVAGVLCVWSLKGQLHWENLMQTSEPSQELRFPIFVEFFLLPLCSESFPSQPRKLVWLPFQIFLGLAAFTLGMELLFGPETPLPGVELLRAGAIGSISRFDAAFLLVWLLAALFRICFLVRVLHELLWRIGFGKEVLE